MGPQGKPQAVNCTGGTAPLSSGKGGFGGNKGGFGGEFGKGGGKGSYGGKGGSNGGFGGGFGTGGSTSGIVKFFNEEKGFGFIQTDQGDIFVHRRQCQGGQPQEGDEVFFDVEMGNQ